MRWRGCYRRRDRPALDRLHIAETVEDALGALEMQLLRRARLATVDSESIDDIDGGPEWLLPPLIFAAASTQLRPLCDDARRRAKPLGDVDGRGGG
jgi:hypothetical protein